MKTYEEMTRSVLQRATAGIAERNRRRKTILTITATGLCLAMALAAVGALWDALADVLDPTQPTISMENPTTAPTQPEASEPTEDDIIVQTGNVYFLSSTKEGNELTPLQAYMTLPVNCMIRVRNLEGMTGTEAKKAIAEEYAFRDEFREKYGNSDGGRYMMQVLGASRPKKGYSAVVQHLSGGKASLILMNGSEIEDFEIETTGVLADGGKNYGTYNRDVTIGEGENAVTIPEGCFRIYLYPQMSNEILYSVFQENPDTPLSILSDTMTITINYKNGTKEIVVIDVTVDDEGFVYMTQRGNNTGV